jgi:hypothetical protein
MAVEISKNGAEFTDCKRHYLYYCIYLYGVNKFMDEEINFDWVIGFEIYHVI